MEVTSAQKFVDEKDDHFNLNWLANAIHCVVWIASESLHSVRIFLCSELLMNISSQSNSARGLI
jgi:hypothetical protein